MNPVVRYSLFQGAFLGGVLGAAAGGWIGFLIGAPWLAVLFVLVEDVVQRRRNRPPTQR